MFIYFLLIQYVLMHRSSDMHYKIVYVEVQAGTEWLMWICRGRTDSLTDLGHQMQRSKKQKQTSKQTNNNKNRNKRENEEVN